MKVSPDGSFEWGLAPKICGSGNGLFLMLFLILFWYKCSRGSTLRMHHFEAKPSFAGPCHLPKFWSKMSKATTPLLTSHQSNSVLFSLFLELNLSLVAVVSILLSNVDVFCFYCPLKLPVVSTNLCKLCYYVTYWSIHILMNRYLV